MAKKDKLGIEKILSRLNKEFEKTSTQLERLVKDALKQIESLQSQIQEPVKKLKEDIEKVRERELNRFHAEFDKKIEEFNKLQNNILEKLGIQSSKAEKPAAKPAATPATPSKAASEKPAVKKATPEKKTTTKKATTKKASAPKKAAQPKKVDDTKLTKLKGVGPAMEKKLQEAGIRSLKQIASPSESDSKILADFAKVKGFETWADTAKELLG